MTDTQQRRWVSIVPAGWYRKRRDQYMAVAREHKGTAIATTYVGMARVMNHDALRAQRHASTPKETSR